MLGLHAVLVTLHKNLQLLLSKTNRIGDTTQKFTIIVEQDK